MTTQQIDLPVSKPSRQPSTPASPLNTSLTPARAEHELDLRSISLPQGSRTLGMMGLVSSGKPAPVAGRFA